ncbi:MAG: hypothetical protein GXO29_00465, partial [Thermotogae bacterium]|nr:hypothetical protein [Thermotogota bacterium]
HADIAPDTGGYADTVLAVVSTDPSYGHALWLDRGTEDIDTLPPDPGDLFGKVRVMEIWGDSIHLKVGLRGVWIRYNIDVTPYGLRWIKGG